MCVTSIGCSDPSEGVNTTSEELLHDFHHLRIKKFSQTNGQLSERTFWFSGDAMLTLRDTINLVKYLLKTGQYGSWLVWRTKHFP